MSNYNEDMEPLMPEDRELRALLDHWHAPVAPPSLDQRVITGFRKRTVGRRLPVWKRFLVASIRVPLPVAAVSAAALVIAGAFALRPAHVRIQQQDRIVEVPVVVEKPVITERVVTRIVYRNQQLKLRQREEDDAAFVSGSLRAAVQSSRDGEVYFTHTKLAGFEPPEDLKIRVIKGDIDREK